MAKSRLVVVHYHQPPYGLGWITGTSHMPSLELCTCFLLAFCCIVLALQLLQSTSEPRCTLQAMQAANPRTIDTWGGSSRNRENLTAALVVRDQWEPRSPADRRGPVAYRQPGPGGGVASNQTAPSAMARPARHQSGPSPGAASLPPRAASSTGRVLGWKYPAQL